MNTGKKHPRRQVKPTSISSVMSSVMGSVGLQDSFMGWKVVSSWKDIVGPDVASRASADNYENGVLYVTVQKDVWRQELQMQKEMILRKIHSLPYGRAIREIRLVKGQKG